ncbi:MAG: transposase [bacterium]
MFRVTISNKRILSLKDGQVTFQYKSPDRKHFDTATVPAEEFTPLDTLF